MILKANQKTRCIHRSTFISPFFLTRVFEAFGCWTLVYVGPATDWGPSAYVYTGFNAFYLLVQKLITYRLTDRQAAPNNLLDILITSLPYGWSQTPFAKWLLENNQSLWSAFIPSHLWLTAYNAKTVTSSVKQWHFLLFLQCMDCWCNMSNWICRIWQRICIWSSGQYNLPSPPTKGWNWPFGRIVKQLLHTRASTCSKPTKSFAIFFGQIHNIHNYDRMTVT